MPVPNQQEATRFTNFTVRTPIGACRLAPADLKTIYRILAEKQREVCEADTVQLAQQEGESLQHFAARREFAIAAFDVTVTINGVDGESVTGNDEDIFTSTNVPERISSIFYSTLTGPKTRLNYAPNEQAGVLLDFTRPPLMNFAVLPTLATPNNSMFEVIGNKEAWVTSLVSRLSKFFSTRKTRYDWLHRPGVYDILLPFFGFSFGIWVDYYIMEHIQEKKWPPFLLNAIYIYGFFISVLLFRIAFSYSRWLFPKFELENARSAPTAQRVALSTVLLGVVAAMIWDAVKLLI